MRNRLSVVDLDARRELLVQAKEVPLGVGARADEGGQARVPRLLRGDPAARGEPARLALNEVDVDVQPGLLRRALGQLHGLDRDVVEDPHRHDGVDVRLRLLHIQNLTLLGGHLPKHHVRLGLAHRLPPFSSMASCSWAKYPRSRYHWSRPVHTRLNSREENVRPMRCWDSSSIAFAGSTLAPVTTTPCRVSFSSRTSRKAIPSRVSSANGVTALKYPVEKTRSTSDCTSDSVYAKFGRSASMPSARSRSSGVPPSTATALTRIRSSGPSG